MHYKNLKFTIDRSNDGKVHFLDIHFDKTETDLYYKPAHTGQYFNITSNAGLQISNFYGNQCSFPFKIALVTMVSDNFKPPVFYSTFPYNNRYYHYRYYDI